MTRLFLPAFRFLCALLLLAYPLRAGEVTTRVSEKGALTVSNAFNKLGKENVGVRVDATTKNADYHSKGARGYNVQIAGKDAASAVMEFCYEVKPKDATSSSILLAARGVCSGTMESFDVSIPGRYSPKELGGWFVRVVKGDTVIGVAGSSLKYEEMAGSPKTEILYGGIQKNVR